MVVYFLVSCPSKHPLPLLTKEGNFLPRGEEKGW